ncbi:Uncharacterised protein [Salmonella enterica subsp. arizonae]|nr:Uncharacterised protein [Salmonella enterica subsp. arizonae]
MFSTTLQIGCLDLLNNGGGKLLVLIGNGFDV